MSQSIPLSQNLNGETTLAYISIVEAKDTKPLQVKYLKRENIHLAMTPGSYHGMEEDLLDMTLRDIIGEFKR